MRRAETVHGGGGIVVVRGGALGDVLLGVPALQALRRRFPGRPLHLVATQPQAGFLRDLGIVDSAAGVDDTSLTPLFLEGRPLDRLPLSLRHAALAVVWLHGGDVIGANLGRLGAERVLVARALPDAGGDVHAAEWLLGTLAPLGISPEVGWDEAPWLPVPEEALAWAAGWRREHVPASRYVVLHPGSGSARKNWAPAAWAAVAERVQARSGAALVVVAGPADEAPLGAFLQARAAQGGGSSGRAFSGGDGSAGGDGRNGPNGGDIVLSVPDLPHLAAVLRGAEAYLGNDSGVTHLAAGVGTPVVAVFGASDPTLWRPRGPRVRVLGGPGAWPSVEDAAAAAGGPGGSAP